MSSEHQPTNGPKKRPAPPPDESLEELTERTAEKLDRARKDVDRARATLHDQIMPASQGGGIPDPEK